MALRRRPAPTFSAPSFQLQLPTAESSAQMPVKLDETVNRRTAEQLIVAVDGAPVDSPFIAMEGQFPGMPARSDSTSGSFDELGHRPSTSADDLTVSSSTDRMASTPAGAPPPGNQMRPVQPTANSQRKFFRVDSCNVYVLVNPNLTENTTISDAEAHDQQAIINVAEDEGNILFDDLEIGDVLGSGSQGTVRAVTHKKKQYALKRISISQALDKTQADVERQARKNAIVRELQMLAQKAHRHPNLVALYNGYFRKDSDEGVLHILMERMGMSVEALYVACSHIPPAELRGSAQRIFGNHYGGNPKISGGQGLYNELDDETLKGRLTPLPEVVVALIAMDALKGLDHFHRVLRFVHTDIKPANLMFDMDLETVKVADFGCSQQLPSEPGSTVSVTNVTLGTKLYMSPERASAAFGGGGSVFNESTDIWSLGVSLLELVAGLHPCHHFRENYWDFADHLKLTSLLHPEQCSSLFWDFITQLLTTNFESRPGAASLLQHDFIVKYQTVPRKKLSQFIAAVKHESAKYERKKLQKTVEQQLSVATKTKDHDHRKRNMRTWQGFQKGIMGNVPQLGDTELFPTL